MKSTIFTLLMCLVFLFPFQSNAIAVLTDKDQITPLAKKTMQVSMDHAEEISIFTQVKPTKKLNFVQRVIAKRLAKKIQRQNRKLTRSGNSPDSNFPIFGLLSLIMSALTFIPPFFITFIAAYIFFLSGLAALILGIIGIRRDENRIMAIIGTILGAISSVFLAIIFFL